MKKNIEHAIISLIKNSLREFKVDDFACEDLTLDLPSDNRFGDLTTNIALRLSKIIKKSQPQTAKEIAAIINKNLEKDPLRHYVREIKAEGAGFINFYLSERYFYEQLKGIILKGPKSLQVNYGQGKQVLIEFVSANPTGPLSVAHARQAAVGDTLANILAFLRFRVKREYYLNDEGNQVNILGRSIELRMKELAGEKIEFPEDHYQGQYIYDIAKKIQNVCLSGRQAKSKIQNFSEYAVEYILDTIKHELEDFGVKFDYWYSQKKLRESGKIQKSLDLLKKNGFLFQQEGALWFNSKRFGDDKDRVVIKSDGSYTYLAPDIAYHQEKYRRGFSWLINLWGPDHHGYINRLKAAVEALGHKANSLSIIIVQLATIFRQGQPVVMSTRRGQYVTLREVLDEVGRDAARFFFLMRRTSSHLDFDLDIAKKQTAENPVYYVQYAHARICSILKNAEVCRDIGMPTFSASASACRRDTSQKRNIRHSQRKLNLKNIDFVLLKEKEELGLIKKVLRLSYILNICLKTEDPYMLTVYLEELAEAFHKFYDAHRVLGEDEKLTTARLGLIEAVRITIDLGLELLGISRPQEM